MPELTTIAIFIMSAFALGLAPGPDNIFVLTQSALLGRIAGFLVTLGLCTGLLLHTAFVAFGIATIFADSVLAFSILKLTGALYLLYPAWQALRAERTTIQPFASVLTLPCLRPTSPLLRGGATLQLPALSKGGVARMRRVGLNFRSLNRFWRITLKAIVL